MSIDIDKIKSTIASTFEIPADMVRGDSSSETIEKWDSIGQINLVMALEERLGLNFTMEEIMQMKSFGTICKVIREKANDVKET